MLALSLMLSVTYYVQNNAGIIGWSLTLNVQGVQRLEAEMYVYKL